MTVTHPRPVVIVSCRRCGVAFPQVSFRMVYCRPCGQLMRERGRERGRNLKAGRGLECSLCHILIGEGRYAGPVNHGTAERPLCSKCISEAKVRDAKGIVSD